MSKRQVLTRSIALSPHFTSCKTPLFSGSQIVSHKYDLIPDALRTESSLFTLTIIVKVINLTLLKIKTNLMRFRRGQQAKGSTRNVPIPKIKLPHRKSFQVTIKTVKIKNAYFIPLKVHRRTTTSQSNYLDNAPVSREMLNLRAIPYTVLSDYIGTLAEKHGVRFTDLKLIGVYDPIPVDIVSSPVLDSYTGKLRFSLRREKGKRPKCLRVAYAKIKSTGKIIQAVFPLS
ncbi:MAG: hypothetical protein AB1546_10140 [bacterium]